MAHALGTWEAVERMLPEGRKKVLDMGCGGFLWTFPEYEIHRCDSDKDIEAQVKKAEMERATDYRFKLCDLNEDFPYADKEFEGVVAIELIEHLENSRHFLRECRRIAKDFIVFTTPNCLSRMSRNLFSLTGRFIWFEEKDYHQSGHITPLFKWQIQQIIDELGMRIEDILFNNFDEEILIIKVKVTG